MQAGNFFVQHIEVPEVYMVQGDFWNKLKQRLREVSTAAADFTEEQALIGKLKFDILNLTRRVERKQREIGQRICELAKESKRVSALNDGDIVRLIAEIDELESLIDIKREEITKVADQVRVKRSKAETEYTKRTAPPPASAARKPVAEVKRPRGRPKKVEPLAEKKTASTKKSTAAKKPRKPRTTKPKSTKKSVTPEVKPESKTEAK